MDGSVDHLEMQEKPTQQDKARFERMKAEYEKLYSEFMIKQIKVYKEKQALQSQLKRVSTVSKLLSEFVCDQRCMQ